ncbi:SAM-dependent methyltransferase [Planctomycetales bacterium 10988]|nr:SAM-dependent methyltransferase [Planctomycetales bacterium 10988]
MWDPTQYELLDFGEGRKLERLGKWILDRPSPAAEGFRLAGPQRWSSADAYFRRSQGLKGRWQWQEKRKQHQFREEAVIRWRELSFSLKTNEFGHIGLFPEQAANWQWLRETLRLPSFQNQQPFENQKADFGLQEPPSILHLFAYTGASTLASAAAGAKVTHIDGAKNVVQWARQNAELSQMADLPVRWIAEDALKYTLREVKRGQAHHGIILDPPSYGHGPKGQTWKIERNLPQLLEALSSLIQPGPAFGLLTCHSPGYEKDRLAEEWQAVVPATWRGKWMPFEMELQTRGGRSLPAGCGVRWLRED